LRRRIEVDWLYPGAKMSQIKQHSKTQLLLEATLTGAKKASMKGRSGPETFSRVTREGSIEQRLTDRRGTDDNFMLIVNTSLDHDSPPTRQTIGKTSKLDDKFANSNRANSNTAHLRNLAAPLRANQKEKDKMLSQTTNLATEKFVTRRKIPNTQTTFSTKNDSFTNKQVASPSNNPVKLAQTLGAPARQAPQKESRNYLLPSEVADWQSAVTSASIDDFSVQHLLGKGAYASTFFGQHITAGVGVALKVYTYSEKNLLKDSIDSEVRILRRLNHPNVVRLYHYCEQPGKSVLVLE
jgi:hypothetical protein